MSLPDKSALRSSLRSRRRAVPATEAERCGQALAQHAAALPGWQDAKHCALYLDSDGEIPSAPLAAICRAAGQQLWLPRVGEPGSMSFARWNQSTQLVRNRYGIEEPPAVSEEREVSGMDILFIPVVGWDREGTRLGMGGGYYDRSLAAAGERKALRVGVAYAFQEEERQPREPWDEGLDFILTEAGLVAPA